MDGYVQCALEGKKKPIREKTVSFDASRLSHDTGILEFPTGPLVTPEKVFQKYF